MKRFFFASLQYFKKTDSFLLIISLISSIYGIILIGSSTGSFSSSQSIIQIAATIIGIGLFVMFSLIDIDIFADKSKWMYVFCILFICTLIPWGVADNTGNRAWLRFGAVGVQPAEIVKIPYAIVLAKTLIQAKEKHGVNSPLTIIKSVIVFAILFVLIIVISSDLGSALVYFFMFAVVLFLGGVSLWWFAAGAGILAALIPIIWTQFLSENQINRILAPYDSSIDPTGLEVTWQANQSKAAIANGGLTGQGLFHGTMTQSGSVPQQHTDFIFSAAGEELGFIGCMVIVALLVIIIARCVYVGVKSNYSLGLLFCSAIGAMFLFQTLENIGMCLGLTPVVGLTLPFFSYGGSSVITNYAAIGIVAGIKMRPKPASFRRLY